MLHTLKGGGIDCLLKLISIKMEHPQPLQVCTVVCIIYDAHRGRGDLGRTLPILSLHLTMRRYAMPRSLKTCTLVDHQVLLGDHDCVGEISNRYRSCIRHNRRSRRTPTPITTAYAIMKNCVQVLQYMSNMHVVFKMI